MARWRKRMSLAARILMVLLLVLSLGGFRILRVQDRLCVLFCVDGSQSIDARTQQEAIEYINEATRLMGNDGRDDWAGLVVFGTTARLEIPPRQRLRAGEPRSVFSTTYTDIARGLRLAMASFPEDCQRRILLLSDGNENLGDALREATVARSNEVDIWTVLLKGSPEGREVLIDRVHCPERVSLDEPFRVKVVLNSAEEGPARLWISRNGVLGPPLRVRLKRGENVVDLLDKFPSRERDKRGRSAWAGKPVTYEVTVECPDDVISANNTAEAFTRVEGKASVLYVEGTGGEGRYLEGALARYGIRVETRGKWDFPHSMAELSRYSTVILSDVPAMALTEGAGGQMAMIRDYVRNLGGGLLMIGGEDSFGVGGYFRTPVEESLPVHTDLRDRKILPSLAIVFCIDKSGSMAAETQTLQKIDLAKEGAVLTLQLLNEWDRVGVVGFDAAAKWVAPLRELKDKGRIAAEIRTLRAGGGTAIYPALVEAYEALLPVPAMIKHIVVLTDGISTPGAFEEIAGKAKAAKITITTVGVGVHADHEFLKWLAEQGEGRYFFAQSPGSVPRIFTKDTLLASRALIVERAFRPEQRLPSEILRGIRWPHAPDLLGFVQTRPKRRSETLLATPKGESVLVTWRYGFGKAAAFTSDCKSRWAKHWLGWEGYGKFWNGLVRWLMRTPAEGGIKTTVELASGRGRVIVEAVDEFGEYRNFLRLRAVIHPPRGGPTKIRLLQTGPGRYEAEFPATEAGVYFATVAESVGDSEAMILRGAKAAVLSYPPEYKRLDPNPYILARISEITGGRVLRLEDPPSGLFAHKAEKTKIHKEIWRFLLALAAVLLLLDVAVRRFVLPESAAKILFRRGRAVAPESPAALVRLKLRKEEIREQARKRSPVAPVAGYNPKAGPFIAQSFQIETVGDVRKRRIVDAEKEEGEIGEAGGSMARLLRAKRRARKQRGEG
jgi:uncharacterized membrane protein